MSDTHQSNGEPQNRNFATLLIIAFIVSILLIGVATFFGEHYFGYLAPAIGVVVTEIYKRFQATFYKFNAFEVLTLTLCFFGSEFIFSMVLGFAVAAAIFSGVFVETGAASMPNLLVLFMSPEFNVFVLTVFVLIKFFSCVFSGYLWSRIVSSGYQYFNAVFAVTINMAIPIFLLLGALMIRKPFDEISSVLVSEPGVWAFFWSLYVAGAVIGIWFGKPSHSDRQSI